MSHPTDDDALPWLDRAALELEDARSSWAAGNAGRGRVSARRAAGMALKAWLAAADDVEHAAYRTNFMHHLNALADDPARPAAIREAAWRLAARPVPEGGFTAPLPVKLTPMHDAEAIIAWCTARVSG